MIENLTASSGIYTPETALILGAIYQAWDDARMPVDPNRRSSSGSAVTAKDRMEAIAFLTEDCGEWAESRVMMCSAVGIDPDLLRQKAITRLGISA